MLRRVFFTTTEQSIPVCGRQLWAAVRSCLDRTSLLPVLVYSGSLDHPLVRQLRELNVTILQHTHRAKQQMEQSAKSPQKLQYMQGTYMRTEVPFLVSRAGWCDEYVLYCDVDTMFVGDCAELSKIRPTFLAAGPEFEQDAWHYMNAGVQLMNVQALLQEDDGFLLFVQQNLHKLPWYDQSAYNEFFAKYWSRLPPVFNWKPYWPENPDAQIIHFHGPKPDEQRTTQQWANMRFLYSRNPTVFDLHATTWQKYAEDYPLQIV